MVLTRAICLLLSMDRRSSGRNARLNVASIRVQRNTRVLCYHALSVVPIIANVLIDGKF